MNSDKIGAESLCDFTGSILESLRDRISHFKANPVSLQTLEPKHIQQFCVHKLKTVKANTVKHENANNHKALEYAVKLELIPYNVSDRVELPKVEKYVPDYFREGEILDFLEKTKDRLLLAES